MDNKEGDGERSQTSELETKQLESLGAECDGRNG